jgi:hypothetical protein
MKCLIEQIGEHSARLLATGVGPMIEGAIGSPT